ncbi:phosphatase PAP2 family protein [Aquimarina sp. M1]
MRNKITLVAMLIAVMFNGRSQDTMRTTSPYQTDFWKDGAWVAGGLALSTYGLILVQNKDDLTEQELSELNRDDINGIDRWAAGYDDENASKISDIPFYGSFATPFLLLLNKNTRNDAGQLSVMFLETMSTTAAMFTITAGLVQRSRPRVYNEELALDRRLSNDNQRSFYSGHVAASAAATFFAAKVYNDYFPDSKAKPYIWAGAALVPATVGYFRIKSGNHFLTDVILGYALGAATGILVPELHKKKNKNLTISAGLGNRQQVVYLSYRF